MDYAVVGCGRMGAAIEAAATRRGHRRVAALDQDWAERLRGGEIRRSALGNPEVAFEFTAPGSAEANIAALLGAGIGVISGTTGWRPTALLEQALRRAEVGAILAPNFSVGMELYCRLVAEAGRQLGRARLHRPYVLEMHHAAKQDAPSGTARRLAGLLCEVDPRLASTVEGNPDGPLPDDALHVASVRAGREPGTHVVGFDGEFDQITLTHRAGGRAGFALGAVLAAEWLSGKAGLHEFREVVDDLLGGESHDEGRQT